ncbi:baseplate assembly protein [Mergibacter septicus]|uniref:Baseplate assembly protein n=1 Tax=Mergibacter septicus TaxID=221402 RepID=A0A8D4IZS2_9PAST|nr:phage baseplate assembly protein V [Mergibacter septicus]AWX15599.1 baseplate assembly protein [Mergibacter septicus]QDJ14853.1 baseplate assembly protein [Mergibacter septicus]UTU47719.1 phage baseplate assembly protein V [Mergibacter septicus]WMR96674.1 phage baseplate assembly protein V [Mergibacter septicus]
MNIADLIRRIESMIKLGLIHSVDYSNALVRVETGKIITDWLPFTTFRTGTTKTWSPPTVGEPCLLLSPSGDVTTAIAITGLYLTHSAPSQNPDEHVIEFADKARITYNQKSHALSVTGISTAEITASEYVKAITPLFECTQDCKIGGNLKVLGNSHLMGSVSTDSGMSAKGGINAEGTINSTSDVTCNGISLIGHTHNGVERGSSNTGQPQ